VSACHAAVRFTEQVPGHAPVPFRVSAAIAASAAALLLLGASPAGATVPGVNGYLAYETGVRPGIAVVNAIGEHRTPPALTSSGGLRDPAWSPNATRLALTATHPGNTDIYSVARDGTRPRRLTLDPASDSGASWSPDGGSIVFESNRDGDTEIYVMNADGTAPRRLTSTPGVDQHPAWSPDGRRIAFESDRDGNLELYVMAADGSAQTRLTFEPLPDRDPSWSPDGREIAFVSGAPTNLFAISPDSGVTRRLTRLAATDESPAWSPDGHLIAFSSDRAGGVFSLYVIEAHGGPGASVRALRVSGRNPDWAQLAPPAAAPTHGKTANATPIGKVLVKPPGASAFEPLTSPREILLGTRLDTRAGAVNLTTVDPDGRTTTTTASEGIFTLTQTATSTDLTIPTPICPSARASTAYRPPPPDISTLKTKVHSASHQPVRVHGRYTVAAGYGTAWTTTITCSKTTVKVTAGTVLVHNRLTRDRRSGPIRVHGRLSIGAALG
jgi:hypothetical protein